MKCTDGSRCVNRMGPDGLAVQCDFSGASARG